MSIVTLIEECPNRSWTIFGCVPGREERSTRNNEQRRRFFKAQGRWGVCRLCGDVVDMSLSGRAR